MKKLTLLQATFLFLYRIYLFIYFENYVQSLVLISQEYAYDKDQNGFMKVDYTQELDNYYSKVMTDLNNRKNTVNKNL